MSTPATPISATFLPTALGQSVTISDTTAGIKMTCLNGINGVGTGVYTVSVQKIQLSGGVLVETDASFVFSNAVTPPAAPAAGYEPMVHSPKALISNYEYSVTLTIVSGSLPTSALTISIESV